MIEYIQGIKLIKSFNIGGTRFERLEKAFHNFKRDCIRLEAGSAHCHDFIEAMLKNAPIVLLDEATASIPFAKPTKLW